MVRAKVFNLDFLSREPDAHRVGTGIGAAVGGALPSVAAVALAGPIGAVAGGVIDAAAGGYGDKAGAEALNPTAAEDHWRHNHRREPNYEGGRAYDDYAPAYRLGLYGYNACSGTFDENETRPAPHWQRRRESSTLTWPEASAASRAAWTRLDDRDGTVSSAASHRNDDVVAALNVLLEVPQGGAYGSCECAERAQVQNIRILLNWRADDYGIAAAELKSLIRQAGGEPDKGGTTGGACVAAGFWLAVR